MGGYNVNLSLNTMIIISLLIKIKQKSIVIHSFLQLPSYILLKCNIKTRATTTNADAMRFTLFELILKSVTKRIIKHCVCQCPAKIHRSSNTRPLRGN